MKINEKLKQLRIFKNLSQEDLAQSLDIPLSEIQPYENKATPGVDTLIKYSKYFKTVFTFIEPETRYCGIRDAEIILDGQVFHATVGDNFTELCDEDITLLRKSLANAKEIVDKKTKYAMK